MLADSWDAPLQHRSDAQLGQRSTDAGRPQPQRFVLNSMVTVGHESVGDAEAVQRHLETVILQRFGHRRAESANSGVIFYGNQGSDLAG